VLERREKDEMAAKNGQKKETFEKSGEGEKK